MTRADLQAEGYCDMYASSDLAKFGWQIRYWFNSRTKDLRIEFVPLTKGKVADKRQLDSVIVSTYEEQAAFHRKIGAQVVPPGERYDDLGKSSQTWLY